ncbi:MAG: rod shape-determining protein MreC [Deltaproteobacteria bacterium]|nr:rod shape-determining protein MreC [Deltaproteobacteria bacterium]
MRDILHRLRLPLLFAGLAVLAAISLLADQRALQAGGRDLSWLSGGLLEVAAPVQRVLTAPLELIRDAYRRYVDLLGVRDENAALRARVAALEDEGLQLREALLASGALEQVAALRAQLELSMLATEVVGQDVSPWFRSVVLDRGRDHGLRAGMPIVTESGVVGLVTATTPHAARAMLILDRQSAVDGLVQRSRARGIVRGTGGAELEFEYTGPPEEVQVGDLVITSGYGGVYPKGIRIGEVVSVARDAPYLVRRARLAPAAGFERLERVFAVLWRSPTLELLAGDEPPAVGAAPRADAKAVP